jgi:hypothetical protein
MARQCNVDVKDRREAVLSFLRREEPAGVIARRIGVSKPTLLRFRDEFIAAGEAALANGSALAILGPRSAGDVREDDGRGSVKKATSVQISRASCPRQGRSLPPLDPG